MIAITNRQRALLLFVSASGFTAWYAGVGERLEAADAPGAAPPSVRVLDVRPPLRVESIITRDPFAGRPSATDPAAVARAHRFTNPQANSRIDVPNIDVAAASQLAAIDSDRGASGPAFVVRATLVGPDPVAYVASGALMNVVRIGDLLGERRVASIDLDGIGFDDGSRLALPEGYAPTPAPRAAMRRSQSLTLDDLRRLLRGHPAGPSSSAPQPIATTIAGTPDPVPADAGSATARPLPTADPRGLAPGENPTPNLSAPTAFPYPYPYAPAYGARH